MGRKKGKQPKKSGTSPSQTQAAVDTPGVPEVEQPTTGGAQPLPVPDPIPSTSEAQEPEFAVIEVAVPKPTRPFPKRPDFLSIGTPLMLLVNHFLMTVGQRMAYHYDIEIERDRRPSESDPNIVDKDVQDKDKPERKKNPFTRKMATKLNRKVFEKMMENPIFRNTHPVYDGQKNMFTACIPQGTGKGKTLRLKVELTEGDRVSNFWVNIKPAETKDEIDLNVINLYHQGQTCDDEVLKKAVLFLNIMVRHNPSISMTPIGQSIYDQAKPVQRLSQYLVLSYGFYSSVRNLMAGPTLNIDRSAGAFYDSNLPLEILIGMIIKVNLNRMPVRSWEITHRNKVKRELLGLWVEATHIQYGTTYRKYRILGVARESAIEKTFYWDEKDKQISVQEYFRLKYNRQLNMPHLPCLLVGNENHPTHLPMEVCRLLPLQRLRRSMNNYERSQMTTITGQQLPRDRFKMSQNFVNEQFHSGPMAQKNRSFLYEFDIQVDKNLLRVNSKVIPPPTLKYKGQTRVPHEGEWEMYRRGAKFWKAARSVNFKSIDVYYLPCSFRLENWILINMSLSTSFNDNDIKRFYEDLCTKAIEMGMGAVAPLHKVVFRQYEPDRTFNIIKSKIRGMNLKMILFIIPDKAYDYSDEIYSQIKLMGDVQTSGGLATQCVSINKIYDTRGATTKWNRSYLYQLMLKINPKLGGTNVVLVDDSSMPSIFRNKSLMIVGADVNHPAPADKINPSIAALVGSYDNEYSNYYTTVSMQQKLRDEMIEKLDSMAYELLQNYQSKQNCLPQQIIFYRDGVSEGQFQHVIDNEYPLLVRAFQKCGPNYKPTLTFIVVQKRHHTRFMRTDSSDKFKMNMPPGTVVETGVTHKHDFDFYLCSHAGRIGTSRSAHYYVLADENGFTSNDMCKMTYYLCHIYQRCTKSVSIPAPVYYADLAAYRAKVHASSGSSETSSTSDGTTDQQIRDLEPLIKVSDAQKERLYFS